MFSLQSYSNTDTLYANISATQAYDTILAYANNPYFVILDVRTAGEYATHIEGGVNIDFYNSNFSLIIDSLNKNKVYLIHCASGGRSGQVYTMMQAKHFKTVYNMIGGMNAWNTAALPSTSTVLPKLDFLNDSLLTFNTSVGNTDSILVTITNSKNSILHVSSSTSFAGTEFSSSFNNVSLQGARDYSFYVYYQPTDLLNDNIVISYESDGGIKHLYIIGNTSPNNIVSQSLNKININAYKFDNNLIIETNNKFIIYKAYLYNINGKLICIKEINNFSANINLNNINSGLYIVQIVTKENIKINKKIYL